MSQRVYYSSYQKDQVALLNELEQDRAKHMILRNGYLKDKRKAIADIEADIAAMLEKVKEVALCIDLAGTKKHAERFDQLTDELEEWFRANVAEKVNDLVGKYAETSEFKSLF